MEWYQFLREERARKLATIESLSSGRVVISVASGGNVQNVSAAMAAENRQHVAEIEAILTNAGEPIDA